MSFLRRLSEALSRIARARTIVPAVALLVLILAAMEAGPSGKAALARASGGEGMLDMRFGYGLEEAYGLFDRLGAQGRALYARLLGLDFAFALAFMLMQSLMLSALMRRTAFPPRLRLLNLLPWLRSALDVAENLLLLALLGACPERLPWLAAAAASATVLKWIVYYGVLALLLFLGASSAKRGRGAPERRAA